MCAWPAMRCWFRRFFMVPSTDTMGREDSSSAKVGLLNAAMSSSPRWRGLIRSIRESPAPFSSTSSVKSNPFPCSQDLIANVALSDEPGRLLYCAPMVKNNWRAITLLLNLFISRMMSPNGADSSLAKNCALRDACPSRTHLASCHLALATIV